MTLAELDRGRDNNFNLIRLAAAAGVLVTHSYALVGLPPGQEPLRGLVGISFGTVAVDAFFITSGYLVTGSLLARGRPLDFLRARMLRIYPALIVLLLLMVFGLGIGFTTLPAMAFLRHAEVEDFLIKNLTLLSGAAFYLPGVFDANPFPRAVNASLWTLTYELRMYLILFLIGLVTALLPREPDRIRMVRAAVLLMAFTALVAHFINHFGFRINEHSTRLYLMFFAGAACQALKERIPLSWPLFLGAVGALVLSAAHAATFFIAYNLLLAYVLLCLAYRPAGRVRAFNRVGDYSYGAYLYAFPVQQSVAALMPGISLWGMMTLAAAVTLVFAALSWHLLEKRALRLKPAPMPMA